MSTAETPTPLTDAISAIEQTIKRLHQAATFNNEFVLRDNEECRHFAGTLERLLSTIDHYKALSTGRVEGRTPGTVEVCSLCRMDAKLAATHECWRRDNKISASCPIRAMVSP